jgi:hypothetical protein
MWKLTTSNQQCPAYETKNDSASPEVSYLYGTQKAHYHVDIKKKFYISVKCNRLGDHILNAGLAEIHDSILQQWPLEGATVPLQVMRWYFPSGTQILSATDGHHNA